MSRVLLVGESWFVYSVHQKGFDTFYTSEYTEGGGEFVAALEACGHEVSRIPAHLIERDFPTTAEALAAIADVLVISDVGANSFLLSKETFQRSEITVDRLEVIRDFVTDGGGMLMVGGYMTFSGIDGKARWGRSPVADVLPVNVLDRDDRIELPAGAHPELAGEHDIVAGFAAEWPRVLGLNDVTSRDGSQVLATVGGHPLLVIGTAGRGRSAAFASDLAPHWAPPEFVDWDHYPILFDRIVRWLARGGFA